MIILFCITAFTMQVTEAAGKESGKEFCACPFVSKCFCTYALISLRGNPARVTSESEADLATLAAAARRDESLEVVEIAGRTDRADVVREELIKLGLQPDRIRLRSDIDLKKVNLGPKPRNRDDVAVIVPRS
jgi:hypothetical protein